MFEKSRRWLRDIIALHERSPAEKDELRRLPLSVRSYLIVSCLVDVYALSRLASRDIPAVAALTIVYALTMLVPPVPSPLGYIRVPRLALTATIALLWSPLHTFIGVAFGTFLGVFVFQLYEPWRAVMNTVNWAYPAAIASFAGHSIFRLVPDPLLGLTAASVVIVVVYWTLNYAALSLSHHFRYGEPFLQYWWTCLKEDPLGQILSAPLSIFVGAIALGYGTHVWVVLFLTGLTALTIPMARAQTILYFASQRTATDLVRALMLALERAVPGAQAHAERVSDLVDETGRRLRMSERTLQVWRQAALLHDVGLIEHQSRTAPPETHAAVGARILSSHPDPVVAEIVREHHTPRARQTARRDRAVILGARVLAAAEAYDELRHGTPDIPALGTHAAVAQALRPLIGTQLDASVALLVLDTAERLELRSAS